MEPPTLSLARRLAARFAALPEVAAVALAGSHATGLAGPHSDSDLDLYIYIYADPEPPLPARAAIAADGEQAEINLSPWEPGDTWLDAETGRRIDVVYRTPAWIEDQLDRLLLRHEPALGYSTALWHNVRTSLPLFDRAGWFAALQTRGAQPYPEELRRAIVAANHPLLRERSFSYRHQIEAALARTDAVAVQHRLTAFIASYFDLLFALNRLPHPGEKRQLEHALRSCPLRPPDLAAQIEGLLSAAAPPWPERELLSRLDAFVDWVDLLVEDDAAWSSGSASR